MLSSKTAAAYEKKLTAMPKKKAKLALTDGGIQSRNWL